MNVRNLYYDAASVNTITAFRIAEACAFWQRGRGEVVYLDDYDCFLEESLQVREREGQLWLK